MVLNKKINVLVSPLDWGLGHATRCFQIIQQLQIRDINVIIAGSGSSFELLKKEFPELEYILLEGYNISYSKNGNMVFKMIYLLPSLIYTIVKEHRKLKSIIKKNNIDAVISDNRYGLFSKRIPSVFITHQLMVKCPLWLKFLEPILYLLNNFFISKYAECWVPDYSGKINLSGDLSHKYPRLRNVYFIGPQSHLQKTDDNPDKSTNKYDLMVILSGPEPQRSIFEEMILKQLSVTNLNALIVSGKPAIINKEEVIGKITILSYLTSDDLIKYINKSNIILCRSGYSSIMDLCVLGKKAILVATPGQTEQAYLAENFRKKKIFFSQTQKDFDICKALKETELYQGMKIKNNDSLLNKRIDNLLEIMKERK